MKRRLLEILNDVKKKVPKAQGGVDCGLAIPLLILSRLQCKKNVPSLLVASTVL